MRKNIGNRGFSLVELLAVVAIIGILAVIGIPQYHKFRIKAFQAEAKTQLAAIHTAESTFFLEHETYHPSIKAIGYAPMGRARYNVGFGHHDPGLTVSSSIYFYDVATLNSKSMCAGPFGNGADTRCQMVNDTPNIATSATATTAGYAATAVAYEEQLITSNSNPTVFSVAVELVLGAAAHAVGNYDQAPPRISIESGSAPSGYDSWVIDHNNRLRKAFLDNSIEDCDAMGTCQHTTPYNDPVNNRE